MRSSRGDASAGGAELIVHTPVKPLVAVTLRRGVLRGFTPFFVGWRDLAPRRPRLRIIPGRERSRALAGRPPAANTRS